MPRSKFRLSLAFFQKALCYLVASSKVYIIRLGRQRLPWSTPSRIFSFSPNFNNHFSVLGLLVNFGNDTKKYGVTFLPFSTITVIFNIGYSTNLCNCTPGPMLLTMAWLHTQQKWPKQDFAFFHTFPVLNLKELSFSTRLLPKFERFKQ